MDQDSNWDNVDVLTSIDDEPQIKDDFKNANHGKLFKVKNYIPRRSSEKYLIPCLVGSGAAVILIIIIIVIASSLKSSGNTSDILQNKSLVSAPLELILRDGKKLWSIDLTTKNFTAFHQTKNPISAFATDFQGSTFWTETNATRINFSPSDQRLNATHYNQFNVFDDSRVKSTGMAVDYLTDNLYIVDESMGALFVVNKQTKYCSLLMTELKRPHEIVLDSAEGIMFVLQRSNSILRLNMDGTSPIEMIESSSINSITLDRQAKRIYWINDMVNIFSADYYIQIDRVGVVTDSVNIASLTIIKDQLFWLWPSYEHPATLWSCKLTNHVCGRHEKYAMNQSVNEPDLITTHSYQNESTVNPCKVNNGGCQHLCLIKGEGKHSCVCNIGWQLNSDYLTCREVKSFILYTMNNKVKGRSLDSSRNVSIDVIWPTPYTVDTVKIKGAIDFDYDQRNDNFYFSDDKHIYSMKLKSKATHQDAILSNSQSEMSIEDIAFDWLTGNLYYSLRSSLSTSRHSLIVYNVNKGTQYQKTLSTFKYDRTFGLQACPYAIVLDPAEGYVFFTAGENGSRSIIRTTMNGTKISQIFNIPFVHEYRLMAIDYDKSRIYWISDSVRPVMVNHANFDGSDDKKMYVNIHNDVKTIYVHQQYLYLSTLGDIWRLNKDTGKDMIRLLLGYSDVIDRSNSNLFSNNENRGVVGVRVISSVVQSVAKNSRCLVNNGNCDQICYAGQVATCDCRDGMTVQADSSCS